MIDVRENNRFLPLRGEPRRVSTEALIKHRARWSDTPTWNRLNVVEFWLPQFDNLSHKGLMNKARVLGIKRYTQMSTPLLRVKLAQYFINRVDEMSRGIY